MLLMRLISPRAVPIQAEWKLRHKFYHFLLKAVSLLYVRGKIDDRIVVNGVEVTHNLCDEWFENELRRFDIGISMTYHVTPTDCLDKRWYHRFSMFKWEEELKITHQGAGCCIARDNRVNFKADVAGVLLSSSDDMVSIRFDERVDRIVPSKIVETIAKPKIKKIHFKEADSPLTVPSVEVVQKETSPKGTYNQHKGFEENDIF